MTSAPGTMAIPRVTHFATHRWHHVLTTHWHSPSRRLSSISQQTNRQRRNVIFSFYVCLKWLLPPTLHSKQQRPVDKMSNKIINFSPGPSKLPEDVRPQFLICFYSIMLQYKLLYCFRFCYKFNENCLTITERVSVSWRWVIDPQSLWKLSLMLSKIFDTFCKSSSYKIKHC